MTKPAVAVLGIIQYPQSNTISLTYHVSLEYSVKQGHPMLGHGMWHRSERRLKSTATRQ